ncbi:aspartyl/glutamyl-tRNA amidotransferase subunit C [Patescibacteria group bacterium]|nr:aspartyl/glutamyl-tRNA amidotransferase subunit C [Patescibacteria group bacterium]
MEFKKEQIEYLAELSKLHVDTDKVEELHKQLKSILEYIGQLTALDDLPATAKFDDPVKTVNVWRDDIIKPLSEEDRRAILDSAPDKQEDLIRTKPVFKNGK